MKSVINIALFLFRLGVGASAFVLAWMVCWLAFDVPLGLSFFSGAGAGLITFFGMKWAYNHKTLKNSGMSRREYKYIQEQLRDGKAKIGRLQKVMFSVGNVLTIKQNYDVLKVAKRIQKIVEDEPKRFYNVEQFYYSHLDSLVELTEKYAFLTKQPVKTKEIQLSLSDTRQTIASMSKTVEQDLTNLLADDMETLQMEIDFAKQTIDRKKDNPPRKI